MKMKRLIKCNIVLIFLMVFCPFLCACEKEDASTDVVTPMYKGTLREEGVFIGSVSEDHKTMRVSHRGGIWTVAYAEGYKAHDSALAIIADNDTPEDFTDDIFVGFISKK